ncbi:MAG: EAL domain-containing protein [Nocardioides sp.]
MTTSSWRRLPDDAFDVAGSPASDGPAQLMEALRAAHRRIDLLTAQVHESTSRLESLMRHSSDVTIVTAEDTTLTYASPALVQVLGHLPDGWLGRPLVDLAHPEDRDGLLAAARTVVTTGATGEVRARFRHLHGHDRHVAAWLKDARADSSVGGLVWNLRDITQEALLAERLRHQAFHDHLTGLSNRALFLQRLEETLADVEADRSVAVCLIDLDKLKEANDRYGHQAGDALLQVAAQRFRSVVRPGDTLARLGGDEFGVLFQDVDLDGATAAAQRLIRSLEEPVTVGDVQLDVSASFGLSMVTRAGVSVDRCMDEADIAMYGAKSSRTVKLMVFDPSMVRDDPRTTAGEIADLLADPDGLATVYQPICSLDDARVVGYEALTRFPGREHRTVEEWFRLGRLCQRSAELESAALRQALAGPRPADGTYLTVNVSPEALETPGIQAALAGDLSRLVIEITEHNELDGDLLNRAIRPLRARGARIAVDDTGAGYANLQQLVRLRPDIVKLDRELVHAVHQHPEKRALVEALVSFCRRTGASLCAEGIEVTEELVTLADVGVSLGQGWLLGRPDPEFLLASPAARAVVGTQTFGTGPDNLSPVLTRIAASPSLFDLGGAVRALGRLFPIDDIALSVIEDGCMRVFTQHDWSASGAQYRLEDYPASKSTLEIGEMLGLRVDDPEADPAEVRLLREIGFGTLMMVPVLEDDGSAVALMELYARDAREWSDAELQAARATVGAVKLAIRRIQGGSPGSPSGGSGAA